MRALLMLLCATLLATSFAGEAPAPSSKLSELEALGGGEVRLTWTAPRGAPARYQVKWAEKLIVELLKWPDEKDTRANWWAANNVEGEPKPGAAGAKESMTVEGVTPGKKSFAIRSFDSVSNRSAMSNVVAAEVK